MPTTLYPPKSGLIYTSGFTFTKEQHLNNIEYIRQIEKKVEAQNSSTEFYASKN